MAATATAPLLLALPLVVSRFSSSSAGGQKEETLRSAAITTLANNFIGLSSRYVRYVYYVRYVRRSLNC